jgi:hypothetical protein
MLRQSLVELTASAVAARESVSFDFGWLHQTA